MQTDKVTIAYPDAGDTLMEAFAKARIAKADYLVFNYRLVRISPGALLPSSMTISTYINNREPGWQNA